MILQIYTLKDRLMNVFLTPFYSRGNVDATRQMTQSLKDPQLQQTPFVQNAKDYDLYHVGNFDDETAILTATTPELLANLGDLHAKIAN